MQQELIAANWRTLIRPRRLMVEEEEEETTYGRFFCEPLERGFGTTLGNALRRVTVQLKFDWTRVVKLAALDPV